MPAGRPAGRRHRHPARAAAGTSRPGCFAADAALKSSCGSALGSSCSAAHHRWPAAQPTASDPGGSGALLSRPFAVMLTCLPVVPYLNTVSFLEPARQAAHCSMRRSHSLLVAPSAERIAKRVCRSDVFNMHLFCGHSRQQRRPFSRSSALPRCQPRHPSQSRSQVLGPHDFMPNVVHSHKLFGILRYHAALTESVRLPTVAPLQTPC